MKDCFIYFFYDSVDTLLYIGKSTNLKSRLKNHFSPDSIKLDPWKQMVDKEKIVIYKCENPTDLDVYETYLINKYQPLYNKDKVFNYFLSFDLPKLEPYPFLDTTNEKINLYNNCLNKKQRKALKRTFTVDFDDHFTKYNASTGLLEICF